MAVTKKVGSRGRYVVAVTASRPWAVVAGYLAAEHDGGATVELEDARMICYFSADARTIYGLATTGPGASGRVSPAVGRVRVHGVEHLLDATDAARSAIEAGPWI
jgi:hypothetical protein